MAATTDRRIFIPLSGIVRNAILDMREDFGKEYGRYTNWAVRGIKKLTNETLKSGKRYVILTINHNLKNAILPDDFKDDLFVGLIDECGNKIALSPKHNIVNTPFIETIPCDIECEAKCTSCYSKQLCNDLVTTQVIKMHTINDIDYEETKTSTLLPSGEYFVVTTTPYYNAITATVDYKTTKEYVTTFDVAECGCVKQTEDNATKLKTYCYDCYCCYCSSCVEQNQFNLGGYRIFPETGTIQFDGSFGYDKVYLEYRGCLPKQGNEYLVPEAATETLTNFVKFKSLENKRGTSLAERNYAFEQYTRERSNMEKVLGRMGLAQIIQAALLVPKFDLNLQEACGVSVNNAQPSVSVINGAAAASQTSTSNTTEDYWEEFS